jgi:hypothetical protein
MVLRRHGVERHRDSGRGRSGGGELMKGSGDRLLEAEPVADTTFNGRKLLRCKPAEKPDQFGVRDSYQALRIKPSGPEESNRERHLEL